MLRVLLLFLIVCSSVISTGAQSYEPPVINGFATAGFGVLSSDKVALGSFDEDIGFREDTIFGLQVQQKVTDKFSLTGQLVGRGNEDFDAEVTWGYITYTHSLDTQVKLGRIRLPLFHYSDQQEVGYSYLWIRPPVEVYQFPFSSIEAISVNHQLTMGGGKLGVEFYLGHLEDEIRGLRFQVKNSTGLILKYRHGQLELRSSFHRGTTTQFIEGTPLEVLPTLDSEFDPEFGTRFYSMSGRYQMGNYFAFAELMRVDSDSALTVDRDAWLVQVGRYYKKVALHLTYSVVNPDPFSGSTGELQKGFVTEERSLTAGVRYDLDEGVALKFEIQHHNENINAGEPGEEAMLYSAAVDMVF